MITTRLSLDPVVWHVLMVHSVVCGITFDVYVVGAQDTEDGAHEEGEYGGEEPLREQVNN